MARHDGQVTDTAGRLLRLLPLLTARPSWRGDEPPGLRDRCAVLAGRLRQAANRYQAEEQADD